VISYVAPPPINACAAAGPISNSWHLTSIQAGFERWNGGTGRAIDSFSLTSSPQ
jgi:hypothetical protein